MRRRRGYTRPLTDAEFERFEECLRQYKTAEGWVGQYLKRRQEVEARVTAAPIARYGIEPHMRGSTPTNPTANGGVQLASLAETVAQFAYLVDMTNIMLRCLSPEDSRVIRLRYIQGEDCAYVARVAGICRQTVHNRCRQILEDYAELFEPLWNGEVHAPETAQEDRAREITHATA